MLLFSLGAIGTAVTALRLRKVVMLNAIYARAPGTPRWFVAAVHVGLLSAVEYCIIIVCANLPSLAAWLKRSGGPLDYAAGGAGAVGAAARRSRRLRLSRSGAAAGSGYGSGSGDDGRRRRRRRPSSFSLALQLKKKKKKLRSTATTATTTTTTVGSSSFAHSAQTASTTVAAGRGSGGSGIGGGDGESLENFVTAAGLPNAQAYGRGGDEESQQFTPSITPPPPPPPAAAVSDELRPQCRPGHILRSTEIEVRQDKHEGGGRR